MRVEEKGFWRSGTLVINYTMEEKQDVDSHIKASDLLVTIKESKPAGSS